MWLEHFFEYAEVYTVLLSWVVVPLAFYSAYLFFRNHSTFMGAPQRRKRK